MNSPVIEALAPFPWAEMSAEEARIANVLSAASGRLEVAIGGRRYAVAFPAGFSGSDAAEPYRPALRANLRIDNRRAALDLDRVPFQELLGYPPAGLEPRDVPSDVLAALLEGALAPLLDAAEARLGRPVRVESVLPAESGPAGALARDAGETAPLGRPLPLTLDDGETGVIRVRLFLAPQDLAFLAAQVEPAARAAEADAPRSWEAVPLSLRYRVGLARLTVAEGRDLAPGDIVFLAGDPAARGGLRLCAGRLDADIWKATWKKGHVVLEEEIKMENNPATSAPAPEAAVPEAAAAHGPGAIEALEMLITFDMGSRNATVAELRAMGPGAVLPLPDNPDGKVTLRVAGQAVGTGSLLMVDGRAGVRLDAVWGASRQRRADPEGKVAP